MLLDESAWLTQRFAARDGFCHGRQCSEQVEHLTMQPHSHRGRTQHGAPLRALMRVSMGQGRETFPWSACVRRVQARLCFTVTRGLTAAHAARGPFAHAHRRGTYGRGRWHMVCHSLYCTRSRGAAVTSLSVHRGSAVPSVPRSPYIRAAPARALRRGPLSPLISVRHCAPHCATSLLRRPARPVCSRACAARCCPRSQADLRSPHTSAAVARTSVLAARGCRTEGASGAARSALRPTRRVCAALVRSGQPRRLHRAGQRR